MPPQQPMSPSPGLPPAPAPEPPLQPLPSLPPLHSEAPQSAAPHLKKPTAARRWLKWLLGFLAIVVIAVVAFLIGHSTVKKTAAPAPTNNNLERSLQPAESIDVDQANNSISQDIAGLHDDTNFPTNALDDKTLGL